MVLPLLKKCRGGDKLANLPVEILMEILLVLTAKDLQNLKSVSEFWNSFISNPDFIKAQHAQSQSQSPQHIFFETVAIPTKRNPKFEYGQFGVNMKSKVMDINIPQNRKVLTVKACCDGLVLFQDKYAPKQLYISNPVTAQFQPLPLSTFSCSDWALAYDSRIKKYKVFAIHCQVIYTHLTLGVETASWLWYGETQENPTQEHLLSNVILIHKELHWLTIDEDSEHREFFFVYSVHVEEYNKFRKIRAPLARKPDLDFKKRKGKHLLSDLNGSLCLTYVSHNHLRMFVLEDRDRCLWTNSYTVHLQSLSQHSLLFGTFLSDDICLVAVGGVGSSDLSDVIKVLVHVEDRLFLYDLKTQEKTFVGFMSKERKLSRDYFFHSESLISWSAS
ncbi:hypothetical protein ACHQM5_000446 [Ranunculus cassubicifolius]